MSILSKIKSFIMNLFKRKEDDLDRLIYKEIEVTFNHYNNSINFIQKADGYKMIKKFEDYKNVVPINVDKKMIDGMVSFISTSNNYVYIFPDRVRKSVKALYKSDKDMISAIIVYIILHELSHINQNFREYDNKVIMEYCNDCNVLDFINTVDIEFYNIETDKMESNSAKFDMLKNMIITNLQILSSTGSIYGDPGEGFSFITTNGLDHYRDCTLNTLYKDHRTSCMILQFIFSMTKNNEKESLKLNEILSTYNTVYFGKALDENSDIESEIIYENGEFTKEDHELYDYIVNTYNEIYIEGSYLAAFGYKTNEIYIVLIRK